MKVDDKELDIKELEAAEYEEGSSYTTYDGELPPKGTQLRAFVKKMWWTYTGNDDPMLKVLVEAGDNEGDLEEYDGLPMWENLALTAGAKFKWAPFLDNFGLTIRDVKTKTIVGEEDDERMGGAAPIQKIADFEPGSEDAWCEIITSRERYNGNWQAHVAEWLVLGEDAEEEPDEEEDEELEVEEEEEIDDDDDEGEDEEEETPPPPAKGRRGPGAGKSAAAAKPAATKPTVTRGAKASASAAKAPARGARTARSATSAKAPVKTSTKPARGRRAKADEDEPPF